MTVKLFASLRHGRFNEQQLAYIQGITISSILEDLNIDRNEVGILLVNGCHVKPDYRLQEGDALSYISSYRGRMKNRAQLKRG